jgi:hypothetical protein
MVAEGDGEMSGRLPNAHPAMPFRWHSEFSSPSKGDKTAK